MPHAYYTPAITYFGTPERAHARSRHDDDDHTDQLERVRDREVYRDDRPSSDDDGMALDDDVISVDDDGLTVDEKDRANAGCLTPTMRPARR